MKRLYYNSICNNHEEIDEMWKMLSNISNKIIFIRNDYTYVDDICDIDDHSLWGVQIVFDCPDDLVYKFKSLPQCASM